MVLAGNNENEAALATDWYNTSATAQEKEFYFGEGFTSNFLRQHTSIRAMDYGP